MKYYAEITLNNQPKNKAEEDCQLLAILYNQALIPTNQLKDELYEHLRNEVKTINLKHRRCKDVHIGSYHHGKNMTVTLGETTQLTFKAVLAELETI